MEVGHEFRFSRYFARSALHFSVIMAFCAKHADEEREKEEERQRVRNERLADEDRQWAHEEKLAKIRQESRSDSKITVNR